MENEYIKNYFNDSKNKGECKIIENTWKCKINYLKYNALKYYQWETLKEKCYSILSFNLKENKLTIHERYYDLIVFIYKHVSKKYGNFHIRTNEFNKHCRMYDEIIYCSCLDRNNFGIVTFHFENNSKLDIDLRNYVYYNKSVFYFKCKIDIILSKNNEFIVGLIGLNNIILSFNVDEKKLTFSKKLKELILE